MKVLTVLFLLTSIGVSTPILNRASNEMFTSNNGAAYFYENYDKFELFLGSDYGSYRVRAVEMEGENMIIKYDYKNGTLDGRLTQNGGYYGNYQTSSTEGTFDLRFKKDGTANGAWKSNGWIPFGGSLKILRK